MKRPGSAPGLSPSQPVTNLPDGLTVRYAHPLVVPQLLHL